MSIGEATIWEFLTQNIYHILPRVHCGFLKVQRPVGAKLHLGTGNLEFGLL